MGATVTNLLHRWQQGDERAFNEVVPMTLAELHQLARHALRHNRQGNLQPTELVNEAYLKLVALDEMSWQSRVQFFAMASKVMRNLLLDGLRREVAQKRGGGPAVTLFELPLERALSMEEITTLNDALNELAAMDERKARVVEMRLFAGMNHTEIASFFQTSEKTVKRDWQFAKVWLYGRLKDAWS